MIEQSARVISLKQGHAWVQPLSAGGGCAGCSSASSSCAASGVFKFMRSGDEKIYVQNPLHARPGDEVVIGMPANTLLIYSLFAYLLPLLSMIVFAVLGKELFVLLQMHADMGAILAGAAGLFSGLKLAGWLAQNTTRSSTGGPVILRYQEKVIEPIIPVSHA